MMNEQLGSTGDHLDLLKKRRAGGVDISILLGADDPSGMPQIKVNGEDVTGASPGVSVPVQGDENELKSDEAQEMAPKGDEDEASEEDMGAMFQGPLASKKMAMMKAKKA